ncbi:TAXI family TRAP transporter solute-binding subunit [Saccharospirillum sp. HFRX-1]|uniref:TAXI family TRAP transporter solute-binding subunit n=1 Tax=unclassified Saccharospirillum TaxID=2633430 RepID=UPI00372310BD
MKTFLQSLCAGLALLLCAGLSHAENLQMDAGGSASVTGILPQTFAQYANREGISLQVVLGQTLTRSVMMLGAGRLDTSVVPPPAFNAMRRGVGPYASNADQAKQLSANVRAITGLPGSTYHAITWADDGIESWDDLRGKRVYVGPPAGAANMQIMGMIEVASGLTEADYDAVRAPWGAAVQGFQDGQYDVLVISAPVGQQSINEMSLQRSIRILGIPQQKLGTADWDAYTEAAAMDYTTIPAGTYQGQVNGDEDLVTASNIMFMGTHAGLDDDVAYRLAKAYWDNIDELKASNALLRSVSTDNPFAGVNAPLHPGALRYYREHDIAVPDALLPPAN